MNTSASPRPSHRHRPTTRPWSDPLCTLGNAAFAERIISEAYAEEEETEEETNETSSESSAESSDPFYTDNSISFYAFLNNADAT